MELPTAQKFLLQMGRVLFLSYRFYYTYFADCQYEGHLIGEGSSITIGPDGCSECHCKAGSVTCERQPCPPVTCRQPRPGKCCPKCEDPVCHYEGQELNEGQIVPVTGRPCEECSCHDGRIHCSRIQCPQINCVYPLQGECCPSCAGKYNALACGFLESHWWV